MSHEDRKKTLIKDLRINEVSLVTNPANPGAYITLQKIDTKHDDVIGKSAFKDILNEIEIDHQLRESLRPMYELSEGLQDAFRRILADKAIKDKKAELKKSVQEFADHIKSLLNKVKLIKNDDRGTPASPTADKINKEAETMPNEAKLYDEATAKELVEKAVKDATDKLQAELEIQKRLAGFSDAEKSYYGKLNDQEKEKFLKADDAERRKLVETYRTQDEVLKTEAGEIRKSEVGDKVFVVLKLQHEQIEKANRIAAEERAARERTEFAKKAEEEFPHIIGKAEDTGKLIQAILKLDSDSQKILTDILKSANESMSKAFTAVGIGGLGDGITGAEEKLQKSAEDLANKEGISFEKAYSRVLQTPEGRELYREFNQERHAVKR